MDVPDLSGLTPDQARETLAKLGLEYVPPKQLPDDDWEFATKCCYTFDEKVAGDPSSEVVKLFPNWEYLRIVFDVMEQADLLRIDKSGQLLISWAILIRILKRALKYKGYRCCYWCETVTKAEGHLKSRLLRTYRAIPSEYDKPYADIVNGEFVVFHDGKDQLPTAFITPLATEQRTEQDAAEKMRAPTWSEGIIDEGAFPRNLKELVGSLKPRCNRIIIPSTANGIGYFQTLGFGNIHDPKEACVTFDQLPDKQQLHKGVWAWKRNGFQHLRVHYSAHPERDPDTPQGLAWKVKEQESTPTDLWNREQEIDYDVQAGNPVFCDTDRIKFIVQEIRGWLKFFGGWDPGYLWPFAYAVQLEPVEFTDEHGKAQRDIIVHVLYEFVKPNTEIYEFGQWVKADRTRIFGPRQWEDWGDDASKHRTETGQTAEVLSSIGITILSSPTGPGGVMMANTLIQRIISAGNLHVDPLKCPFLKTALVSGYTRGADGKPITGMAGHPYCDAVQAALQYTLVNLLGLEYQPTGRARMIEGGPLPSPPGQPRPAQPIPSPNSSPSPLTRSYVPEHSPRSVGAEVHTARMYVPKRYDPKAPVRR